MKTVFIDSSVLFSAVNSPTGGSAKLFTLKNVKLVTSEVVLAEVERNVRKKLLNYHLERFFMLAERITIIKELPSTQIMRKAKEVIASKDAVILASAKQAKTDFLVTLDRKHFLTPAVERFLKTQRVLTPKTLFTLVESG